jgi:hypothetical protein
MSSHEDREKVSTKSLNRALGLVGAFLGWWDALHVKLLGMRGIHCPRPYLLAEVYEELVRARKGGYETRFVARGEKLGVDISFVLRDHYVLGPVGGGDRELAG